jgi:hypothetical protein
MMDEDAKRMVKLYGSLSARAAIDPGFRAELEADPAGVLAANGLEVGAGMRVEVVDALPADFTPSTSVENGIFYFVVGGSEIELTADELQSVAGGGGDGIGGCFSSLASTMSTFYLSW